MGFFDGLLIKDVKDRLISKIKSNDKSGFYKICVKNADEIKEKYEEWLTVPEDLRENSEYVNMHALMLQYIAQFFADNGEKRYLNLLTGGDNNPIKKWDKAFAYIRDLMENKEYEEAAPIMEKIIEEMKELKGTAVEFYLPRIYGDLGIAEYHLGHIEKAIDVTDKAMKICKEIGDEEGYQTYKRNKIEMGAT